jgi:hypothetical protein
MPLSTALFALVVLFIGGLRAAMSCPSGLTPVYQGGAGIPSYVKCCVNRACQPADASDFTVACTDLFPTVPRYTQCVCGRMCNGTAQLTPTPACVGGPCTCDYSVCCLVGAPCNATGAPTPMPTSTAQPTRAPVVPVPVAPVPVASVTNWPTIHAADASSTASGYALLWLIAAPLTLCVWLT